MRVLAVILLVLISASARAEDNSPEVMALQAKLMKEISSDLQCLTETVKLQQANSKLTAEVKALKDKYEPEKPK